MTLDELTQKVAASMSNSPATMGEWDDRLRSAVLTVLEAVERECVPSKGFCGGPTASAEWDSYNDGYADCRAEMLRRIAEMRR